MSDTTKVFWIAASFLALFVVLSLAGGAGQRGPRPAHSAMEQLDAELAAREQRRQLRAEVREALERAADERKRANP